MVDDALYLLKTRGDAQNTCLQSKKLLKIAVFLLKTSMKGQRRVVVHKSSV